MKNIANRFFLVAFAASAAFLGTAAYGQSSLKADVPFAFSVPGGGAVSGNYIIDIDSNGSSRVLRLYNTDTHKAVAVIATSLTNGKSAAIEPRLVFRCSDAGCALAEVWTPDGGFGVPAHKMRTPEYLAKVPLELHKGN